MSAREEMIRESALTPFECVVRGVPIPQGSKSAFVRGDRAVIVDGTSATGRAKHKSWRQEVTQTIMDAKMGRRFEGPVSIRLIFWMPPVKSDQYRTRHATKPDLDKLVRSIFDSLTSSGLIRDDSQVWELEATKFYARNGHWTGVKIEVGDHEWHEVEDRAELKGAAKAARRGGK
ncbi:MAG TPA: RusA family crossover junction endodeoxyribonuclease [Acidimicrobiales bacterium]|nr:RusA family crossover junction endodeoxyribonuclease [Acidimicrobiales bacterium]